MHESCFKIYIFLTVLCTIRTTENWTTCKNHSELVELMISPLLNLGSVHNCLAVILFVLSHNLRTAWCSQVCMHLPGSYLFVLILSPWNILEFSRKHSATFNPLYGLKERKKWWLLKESQWLEAEAKIPYGETWLQRVSFWNSLDLVLSTKK